MPNRKHRRSAVAMMMVAGGLVAAAPIGSASAQKVDAGNNEAGVSCNFMPEGTTGVVCNFMPEGATEVVCNFMPGEFLVMGKKLFLIGKDGTQTEAPDGKWVTTDGKVIVVDGGYIIGQ